MLRTRPSLGHAWRTDRGIRRSDGDRVLAVFAALVRAVRRGPSGEQLLGFFKIVLLDKDLELGQTVDRQRIDERGRPAAHDAKDAVAFQEILDQLPFEGSPNAGDLLEVPGLFRPAVLCVLVAHGSSPFLTSI